jgi:hypothetical protein
MKIEEKFYTISESELRRLCNRMATRFHTTGYDNEKFSIEYHNSIENLLNFKRMSFLNFEIHLDVSKDG